jgi:serine protease inhibitor
MHLYKMAAIGSLLLCIFSFSAFSQTAGLTGTVVDGNGAPVPGALVALHKAGVSVYTDRKGGFAFDNLQTGVIAGRPAHAASQFFIRNNALYFISSRDGQAVQVGLFDLRGREVVRLPDKLVDKGSYSVPLLIGRSGPTVHSVLILRARVGSEEFIHRIGPASGRTAVASREAISTTRDSARKTAAPAVDSITIEKFGFFPKSAEVFSLSGSLGSFALDKNANEQLTATDSILASANTKFGFTIFRKLVDSLPDSNVIISPFSISQALTMTWNGSAAATYDSMKKVLDLTGMTDQEINSSSMRLRERLTRIDPKVTSSIANSIWCRSGAAVKDSFLQVNRTCFNATVRDINFDIPASADTINQWVSDNTSGKITSMVDKPIDAATLMILLNAVYFKGEWTFAFNKDSTRGASFYKKGNVPVNCSMMHQTGYYNHCIQRFFEAVELPYGFSGFGMVLMLPNIPMTVDSVVGALTCDNWNTWMDGLKPDTCDIRLPKFKNEFDIRLNNVLTKMGMGIAFNDADFSRIATIYLFISEVKHRTFFLVSEEGTEAAASTKVHVTYGGGPPYIMTFSRPFLFVIYEKKSRSILFIGKVAVPNPVGG